jgi:flagellar biosynthesis repressor protein FlbT
MKIHLKRNEKLFINGAVIRLDRRGSIELMNDAQFLMENHIIQQDDAKTPLQQVYFIVQTMLMDPTNSHLTKYLFDSYSDVLLRLKLSDEYRELLGTVRKMVQSANYYAALKLLRQSFHLEQPVTESPEDLSANKQHEAA